MGKNECDINGSCLRSFFMKKHCGSCEVGLKDAKSMAKSMGFDFNKATIDVYSIQFYQLGIGDYLLNEGVRSVTIQHGPYRTRTDYWNRK